MTGERSQAEYFPEDTTLTDSTFTCTDIAFLNMSIALGCSLTLALANALSGWFHDEQNASTTPTQQLITALSYLCVLLEILAAAFASGLANV